MKWWAKLRRRSTLERDLADEIAFHRDMRARDAAPPPFGNETRIREAMREFWTFGGIETTLRDVQYALRGFRRSPAFAGSAIVSLALGIGAVIAIFTAADNLLFRPLPYRDPERLLMIWENNAKSPSVPGLSVSPANYLDWKARNRAFEEMAALEEFRTVLLDGDRAEQFRMQAVSANFFPMLGVQPLRGRLFTPAEDLPGALGGRLLIISHRLWRGWFAGDPGVIGRRVRINAEPRTIIAVMPPGFHFRNREVDLWSPIRLNPAYNYRQEGHYINTVGRLRSDFSPGQAQSEMSAIAHALEEEHPAYNRNWGVLLEPLRDSLVGNVKTPLLVLLVAVGLLLAVACSNVANLLLARYSARHAEIAIRMALGAARVRLMRQLITESLVLAVFAGAIGILLGWYALAGLIRLAPHSITRAANIHIDWRIVAVSILLSVATGVIFGLAPAMIGSKGNLAPGLRTATRWGSSGGGNARAWLIAGEIALSVILLVGASLLFRSFLKLTGVDAGLRPANALTFRLNLPPAGYRADGKSTRFFVEAIRRIEQMPGVRAASAVSHLPFDGESPSTWIQLAGQPAPEPGKQLLAAIRTVMPHYFETIGIPLRRGRDFNPSDNASDAPLRFIVNEAFVRKYLPEVDPVGKRMQAWMAPINPFGEIIGVVGDVKEGSLEQSAVPTAYYIHAHNQYVGMTLVVRTEGDPAGMIPAMRRVMQDLDSTVPVAEARTMETVLGETYARERFATTLLGGFSLAALLLAAIGIYGVLAYAVSERTQEIGVRLALGADPWRVVALVLGNGARFVVLGLGVGMAGALATSKYLATLLYDTGPRDPMTFLGVPLVLLAVALVAAWMPARRASRLDPVKALLGEK